MLLVGGRKKPWLVVCFCWTRDLRSGPTLPDPGPGLPNSRPPQEFGSREGSKNCRHLPHGVETDGVEIPSIRSASGLLTPLLTSLPWVFSPIHHKFRQIAGCFVLLRSVFACFRCLPPSEIHGHLSETHCYHAMMRMQGSQVQVKYLWKTTFQPSVVPQKCQVDVCIALPQSDPKTSAF